jgi:hypothetical protein
VAIQNFDKKMTNESKFENQKLVRRNLQPSFVSGFKKLTKAARTPYFLYVIDIFKCQITRPGNHLLCIIYIEQFAKLVMGEECWIPYLPIGIRVNNLTKK